MQRWPWSIILAVLLYFAFMGFLGLRFLRLMES